MEAGRFLYLVSQKAPKTHKAIMFLEIYVKNEQNPKKILQCTFLDK